MLCGMALTKLDVANLARKSTAQMYPEVPPQFDDPDYHPDYGPPPHQRIGYDPMRRSLEEGLESKVHFCHKTFNCEFIMNVTVRTASMSIVSTQIL